MTAAGRLDYFRKSCDCFFDQTYSNKELVIVNEGPKQYQQELAKYLDGRQGVKFVFLDGFYTLGALRNISIAFSTGDIFVQWDDDDFNMPERLAIQYSHFSKQNAPVCYFTEQLHYYFDSGELYWDSWSKFHSGGYKKFSLIPGTIMARKGVLDLRYPTGGTNCRAGEDSVLAYSLCQNEEDVFLLSEFGHMQVYTFHGKNVWDIDHHKKISMERAMPVSHMLQHRKDLTKSIEYFQFQKPIRVMGREGLAFKYE